MVNFRKYGHIFIEVRQKKKTKMWSSQRALLHRGKYIYMLSISQASIMNMHQSFVH